MKRRLDFVLALLSLCLLLAVGGTALLLWPSQVLAADAPGGGAARAAIDSNWVFVGAALATGLSSLGAGFAVAKVGTAAVGALAEKPDLFGRLLIFIGLAEGIAIYGLIVSILMLNRLG